MDLVEQTLAARALRAYEGGRLRWALGRAGAAAAVTLAALAGCPAPGATLACTAALGALIAACLWRGGAWARGARLGFLAGLLPCWLPAVMRVTHSCGGSFCLTMPAVCLTAGVAAGLLLGWKGPRLHGRDNLRLWLAASAAVVLAGAAGCLPAGLAGLGGMTMGLLAGAAPVLAARTA